MHEAFKQYAESLHPSFERLMEMRPAKIANLPRPLPKKCVYLFSERDRHLYVGRTRQLRSRLRQHSIPAAGHNQAVFAFRLAREATGRTEAAYTTAGSRVALTKDPDFAAAFDQAKARVREMDVRLVEEPDPLRQALLEIYAAVVLQTPYNDFETH